MIEQIKAYVVANKVKLIVGAIVIGVAVFGILFTGIGIGCSCGK